MLLNLAIKTVIESFMIQVLFVIFLVPVALIVFMVIDIANVSDPATRAVIFMSGIAFVLTGFIKNLKFYGKPTKDVTSGAIFYTTIVVGFVIGFTAANVFVHFITLPVGSEKVFTACYGLIISALSYHVRYQHSEH